MARRTAAEYHTAGAHLCSDEIYHRSSAPSTKAGAKTADTAAWLRGRWLLLRVVQSARPVGGRTRVVPDTAAQRTEAPFLLFCRARSKLKAESLDRRCPEGLALAQNAPWCSVGLSDERWSAHADPRLNKLHEKWSAAWALGAERPKAATAECADRSDAAEGPATDPACAVTQVAEPRHGDVM